MASRSGTPIRWREDTGWEYRCEDCVARGNGTVFWPLTDEFWYPINMTRCRACHAIRRRRWEREQYLRRGSRFRARQDYGTAYRKDARQVLREASRIYYWTNVERERAKAKKYYAEHREEILTRKRAQYAARKAA